MTVKELKAIPQGDSLPFSGIYLFLRGSVRKTRQGADFLVVELGDQTGSFSTTCFGDSEAFQFFSRQAEGTAIRIEGHSDHYNDKFSPRIQAVTALDTEDAERAMADLIESAPEDVHALWADLETFVAGIQHRGLRATVEHFLADMGSHFKVSAAAIAMHHAYRHGLLEHTVHMARVAKAILPLYPEVNADLAMAGILLHDVGKIIEYQGDQAVKKTRKGILQGHVVLGYRLARQAGVKVKLDSSLLERLEHIILSHQGELEWGAAAMAATPEAVFVSMIDNLDAKMGMVQRALRNTSEAEEFSEYIPGLKAPVLVTPVNTESAPDSSRD